MVKGSEGSIVFIGTESLSGPAPKSLTVKGYARSIVCLSTESLEGPVQPELKILPVSHTGTSKECKYLLPLLERRPAADTCLVLFRV